MLFRQSGDIGVLENVKTLGIGLHQAVLDAVMDHLDEVTGADRTCMDIALLDPRVTSVAAIGPWNIADTRRQCLEDRVEPVDDFLVAADHHAIAALDTPDAAGGADVHVMQAL